MLCVVSGGVVVCCVVCVAVGLGWGPRLCRRRGWAGAPAAAGTRPAPNPARPCRRLLVGARRRPAPLPAGAGAMRRGLRRRPRQAAGVGTAPNSTASNPSYTGGGWVKKWERANEGGELRRRKPHSPLAGG